ncbi:MAG: hypothetical protein WBL61_24105 [Bryobacteraceae bacterium]
MQPPGKGKLCFVQPAGLLLWMAVQVVSASTLPAQHETRYRVWKLATEDAPIGSQSGPASDPATWELPEPTLGVAAEPDPPAELWPYRFHSPPLPKNGPSQGVETLVWMFLGAAITVLATADTQHERRRPQPGFRQCPTIKPRPPLQKGESAAEETSYLPPGAVRGLRPAYWASALGDGHARPGWP